MAATITTHNIMNFTSVDITVYNENGSIVNIYKRAQHEARLVENGQKKIGTLNDNGFEIPVYSSATYGDIVGLSSFPAPCPDIIVPMLVGQRLQQTGAWPGAVYGSDTGKGAVRNEKGQIIGTKWLIQYCARKC